MMSASSTASFRIAWMVGCTCLVAFLAGFYWLGAERHLRAVNVDATRHDQSAYLEYAREMAETNYAVVGGRNRMPLHPALLSLGWEDGMSPAEWFARAKYINLVLSLLAVAVIWGMARWTLPAADASLLTLITAFTLFVYKAAYAQCEILFYTLLFCTFALMLRLLARPSAPLAIAAGILAGLTYLTKAAVPPLIVSFGLWGALAAGLALQTTEAGAPLRRAGAVVLLMSLFLITVFPYIRTSKERFGQWFYNVNSTFYIWYDSWDEAVAGTQAYGDTEGWPTMPDEQLPSARRYFDEHTAAQILDRETAGLWQLHRNLDAPITYGSYTQSFGAGRYLRLYGLICLAAILLKPRLAWRVVSGQRRWITAGFAASWVLGSILLYAFYVPIAPGPRHALALFVPILFCCFRFLAHPAWCRETLASLGRWRLTPRSLHLLGAVCLVYDLVFVYPNLILIGYAGR